MVTRLLNRIETEISQTIVDCNIIEELSEQLISKHDTLRKCDEEIEELIDNPEELDLEIESSQHVMENIISVKLKIKRTLNEGVSGSVVVENANGESGDWCAVETVPTINASVKLPRLEIDKFYGDVSQWQSFWTQFDTAINSNVSLRNADKFVYLKSYLGGVAARAVMGLSLSDANYEVAIKLLKERFGRKDIVINAHMNKLLNLEPVKKSSDVKQLRRLFDFCEVQIRSLETLGVATDTYGNLLCPVLMKMIPDDIALEFSRRRGKDDEWKVLDLLKFLQSEVESRER
ncbi:hypothetical protein B4U79_02911, partial [Dinothrombium tinctorium]